MAVEEYDVFVIGTGSAGKKVADAAAEAGMRVAIADNREYGGTCANRGCDPKKVLVGVTQVLQHARNLEGKGIENPPKVNWKDLMAFKETFVDPVPFTTERALKKEGIKMYHQSPEFIDEETLSVEGKTVKAKKIVIATGHVPMELKISGREHVLTSDDFLELSELPESMIFIGAGYIGMEFAHIAARCGVKVTVIERSDKILNGFDAQLAEYLKEDSEKLGIKFIMNADVKSIEKLTKNFRVSTEQDEKEVEVKAELVFNTAGRIPATAALNLEKGNVAYEKGGITVNSFLQSTSNPKVYACGDVSASGTLPLTPFSGQEGRIVAKNILKGNHLELEIPPTPSVVFTQPQLATVGMNEKEAKEAGHDFNVKEENVPDWYNAKHINAPRYAFKTLVDKNTGQILGAHLLSPDAGETINLFVLAMVGKLDTGTLKGLPLTYPTWGGDMKAMI
ncbi:dihydrolipoyl dehydrogenase family protein [Flavimarina sp. Hel_I_48]|uniref:dihydrolipoyl dehydrogenase family protein n=1 Tax=Flavimarina sp. Hel_I_48 TaxID=1392488 RepID=UPI0004DF4979|nr:NAD(P)/FAD-dependent oxidoreductase [Flavimarina sp. Hel_I_48]